MKHAHLLTALAAAAACVTAPLAQAQAPSSVTIYGIADVAVERLSNVNPSGGSLTRMPGLSGSIPSRLGFRGSEDLGDGLKAIFTLEQGIGFDSGTFNQGGRAWGRQAFVGLAGPWGAVTFGRQYTMLFWSLLDADILGPNAYGTASLDNYLPNDRVDNAIAYKGTFSGLTVGGTYSLGRDAVNAGPSPSGTNCAGENGADTQACRAWSAMVKYDTPTWGVALAVDEMRGGAGAFAGLTKSTMKDTRTSLNGYVKFGDVKVGAGLLHRKNDANALTPTNDMIYLGAAYPVTPQITVEGEAVQLKFKNSVNKAQLFALRATYFLSKRSNLYATVGNVDNSGTLALSVSAAAAGGAPPAGGSQTGLAAGIRHTF